MGSVLRTLDHKQQKDLFSALEMCTAYKGPGVKIVNVIYVILMLFYLDQYIKYVKIRRIGMQFSISN